MRHSDSSLITRRRLEGGKETLIWEEKKTCSDIFAIAYAPQTVTVTRIDGWVLFFPTQANSRSFQSIKSSSPILYHTNTNRFETASSFWKASQWEQPGFKIPARHKTYSLILIDFLLGAKYIGWHIGTSINWVKWNLNSVFTCWVLCMTVLLFFRISGHQICFCSTVLQYVQLYATLNVHQFNKLLTNANLKVMVRDSYREVKYVMYRSIWRAQVLEP